MIDAILFIWHWVKEQLKLYLVSVLLVCSLLLDEIHTFWERETKMVLVNNVQVQMVKQGNEWVELPLYNWVYTRSVPMSLQWNIKMVTDQIWYILLYWTLFVALRKYQDNRINRTTVLTFVCFGVISLGMYFWNYKTYDFEFVYLLLFIIWILIYKYGCKRPTIRQRISIKT